MLTATQNETMRQLTTVTLIFLPLTFLAGYFGMNFSQVYWEVLTNNGPLYFWEIAIPTTIAITVALTFPYLGRLWQILRRHAVRRGIKVKLEKTREMRRRHGSISISRSDSVVEPISSGHIHLE